nr:MAG TPA: hypothetical protein [Caudoviricetes sp.]
MLILMTKNKVQNKKIPQVRVHLREVTHKPKAYE